MKTTHTTKKGFGDLLPEGRPCRIIQQKGSKVLVQMMDSKGTYYHGNLSDLEPIDSAHPEIQKILRSII